MTRSNSHLGDLAERSKKSDMFVYPCAHARNRNPRPPVHALRSHNSTLY
jgi:hypothetical protein